MSSSSGLEVGRRQCGGALRGRIEHVRSGQRADFLAIDQMLAFLQQMGVTCIQLTNNNEYETAP